MKEVRTCTAMKGPMEYTVVANRTFLPQSIKQHCLFKLQNYSKSSEELQLRKTKSPNK